MLIKYTSINIRRHTQMLHLMMLSIASITVTLGDERVIMEHCGMMLTWIAPKYSDKNHFIHYRSQKN